MKTKPQPPPFLDLQSELQALHVRSEFYEAKISALRIGSYKRNRAEILRLQKLNGGCQAAIAFCIGRNIERMA